jgi:hypothetical protein
VFGKINLPALRIYLVRDVIEGEKGDSREFVPPLLWIATLGFFSYSHFLKVAKSFSNASVLGFSPARCKYST